jgi:hypothetical protein
MLMFKLITHLKYILLVGFHQPMKSLKQISIENHNKIHIELVEIILTNLHYNHKITHKDIVQLGKLHQRIYDL